MITITVVILLVDLCQNHIFAMTVTPRMIMMIVTTTIVKENGALPAKAINVWIF